MYCLHIFVFSDSPYLSWLLINEHLKFRLLYATQPSKFVALLGFVNDAETKFPQFYEIYSV